MASRTQHDWFHLLGVPGRALEMNLKSATTLLVLIATTGLAGTAPNAWAGGSHSTKGYVKKDGSYVAPSGAKNPNNTKADNYSSKGNLNPYSGKDGTKDANKIEPVKPPKK